MRVLIGEGAWAGNLAVEFGFEVVEGGGGWFCPMHVLWQF